MSTTPETLAQTDELIANPTETTADTPEQRIARLEAALAEARQGNLTRPVDIGEKEPVSMDKLLAELRAYNEKAALEREENRRFWEEHSAKNPTPYATPDGGIEYRSIPRLVEKPLYGEVEAAQALVGRQKWESFTHEQKAKLRSIRPSELTKEAALSVLGKDCGIAGMEMLKSDPGRYAALKAFAKRKGII